MQDLDEDKLYSINSILDSLSSRYKDVKTIKEEYQLVKNNYNKMYVDIKSTNRLGEGARKAFLELYNFDQEHDNWNLETLLNQIKVIDNIIYGAEFIDEESNYFMWGGIMKVVMKLFIQTFHLKLIHLNHTISIIW